MALRNSGYLHAKITGLLRFWLPGDTRGFGVVWAMAWQA